MTNTGINGTEAAIGLQINDKIVGNKTVQLQPGVSTKVEFTLGEANTGAYTVKLGTLTGSFTVVPTGKHTLSVNTAYTGLAFTLDSQTQTTPFQILVDVGTIHTVTMPAAVTTYTFQRWDDGSIDPTRTITVSGPTQLYAYFSGPSGRGSCPSLYLWNGKAYTYASEISDGPGWLGFINHYNPDGTITFAYSNPWSYVKLNAGQLEPVNGRFRIAITEESDEIFYLDSIKLITVDHPSNIDVYSTRATYLYNLSGQGTIYTVSQTPSTPFSAINNGENVLSQISELDGNYTVAQRWTWNTLDLNLGNLHGIKQINLIVDAVIAWPTNQAGGNWASQFASQPGVTPSPPPYLEVKDQNGNWIRVPDDRQFPMPPVNPNAFVVNLTGLFLSNDYSLRIHYYQDISFDYIGIDTSQQSPTRTNIVAPNSADLSQLYITDSNSTGNFTRYGSVTELLLEPDDMYVIGRRGDNIVIEFPVDQTPIPPGMTRDYFIVASAWFKGNGLPYLPFTVDPLPFHNMNSFPYPQTETYPTDAQHFSYQEEYNTRKIFQ